MNYRIDGKKIYLRPINLKDVTGRYLEWVNDTQVMEFLEDRAENLDIKSLKKYVKKLINNNSNLFLGIFEKSTNTHIGNVKIGDIHKKNKNAHIGIIIGDKSTWGKGYGAESLILATELAFSRLGLHKLYAGINILNISSMKAFKKAGYKKSGLLKEHIFYKNKFVDSIIVERINYEVK